jgi:hypothetical protein
MPEEPNIEQIRADYRASLLRLQETMQSEYDKTVIALSGGAFGVSVLVVKDLLGTDKAQDSIAIVLAWSFWAISLLSVLWSYFTSAHAMEVALEELDRKGVVGSDPGGAPNLWTKTLNVFSGAFFLLGVGAFAYFIYENL